MDIKHVREQAQEAIKRAQDLTKKGGSRFTPYHIGDKVWLDAKNLTTTHPTVKLVPKCYGPLLITRVISHVSYWLALPQRWHIHPVFHASLLTPYKETPTHGPNFPEPAPDLIEGQPEWEIQEILDSRKHRNQLQYLVQWKGFSEAHDSWELAKNIHADQLIAKFHQKKTSTIRTNNIKTPSHNHYSSLPPILLCTTHTMPSRSSSVEALVGHAMEQGYFLDYAPAPSPSSLDSGSTRAPPPPISVVGLPAAPPPPAPSPEIAPVKGSPVLTHVSFKIPIDPPNDLAPPPSSFPVSLSPDLLPPVVNLPLAADPGPQSDIIDLVTPPPSLPVIDLSTDEDTDLPDIGILPEPVEYHPVSPGSDEELYQPIAPPGPDWHHQTPASLLEYTIDIPDHYRVMIPAPYIHYMING